MSGGDTYISKKKDGLPSKDDEEWIKNTLSSFTNRQTALFKRWINCTLPGVKEVKNRLVVLTPLRLLCIRKRAFGRSVHKIVRVIDFVGIDVNDRSSDKETLVSIETCPFAVDNSITQSRQNKNLLMLQYQFHFPKDIDKEFLDILQWCLYILTRGLPPRFALKLNIPLAYRKAIEDPVGPGQFVIDRYLASCDAQNANRNAGIPALESVVEFVLNHSNTEIFDVMEAFSGHKRLEPLQIWAISHGLAFADCYHTLLLDNANSDDSILATLMTVFETNEHIRTLEIRHSNVGRKTFQTLSTSVALNNSKCILNELNIIDCRLDKNVLQWLTPALGCIQLRTLRITNCFLNNKGCQTLCNALEESGQYATLTHINMSKNHFGPIGSKALASFLEKSTCLLRLVMTDADLDGNEFLPCLNTPQKESLSHLDTLSYIDLSGNIIGDKGSQALGVFLENSRAINGVKLSRCALTSTQLQYIIHGAMCNTSGYEDLHLPKDQLNTSIVIAVGVKTEDNNTNKRKSLKFSASATNIFSGSGAASGTSVLSSGSTLALGTNKKNQSDPNKIIKRPTQTDIMLATNLLCLSLDVSENNLGTKGAEVLVQELSARENYTLVSLNVAKNNFNVNELSFIIRSLTNLACLERVCLSENVKKGSFGRNVDTKGEIGQALAYLCRNVPTLNEIALTGKRSYCVDQGLLPLIEALPYLSNLEFLDISNNRLGLCNNGTLWDVWIEMLRKNRNLRVVKFFGNKLSVEQMLAVLQVLSGHSSIFEKIPKQEISKLSSKQKKYTEQLQQASENVKKQFKDNLVQHEIDQEMLNSLTPELRMEKELRRQVGCQFGIPIERIRGTVKFPDYASRIPQLLVRLKDYLKAKDGLNQEGVFRLQPDGKKFPITKQLLDANVFENDMDINCVANAIKVWYRDLPFKVLNGIPTEKIEKCNRMEDVPETLQGHLPEPYKSMFEWLLDLSVEVCEHKDNNRMDAKNMAVVICPNLYDTSDMPSPQALSFSQALLKFTELAIKWRFEYRKVHPCRPADDMPLIKGGTPGMLRGRAELGAMVDQEEEDDDEEEEEDDDEEEDENHNNIAAPDVGAVGEHSQSQPSQERELQEQKQEQPQQEEQKKNNEKKEEEEEEDSEHNLPGAIEEKKDDSIFDVEKTDVEKMENEGGYVSNYKKGRSSSRAEVDLLAMARAKSSKRKKVLPPMTQRIGTGVIDMGVQLGGSSKKLIDIQEEIRPQQVINPSSLLAAPAILDEDNAESDDESYHKKLIPPAIREENEDMTEEELQSQAIVKAAPKMSAKLAARYSGLAMALDPKKMLPGAAANAFKPKDEEKDEEKDENKIDHNSVMQRAAIGGGRRKTKQKKKSLGELIPDDEDSEEKKESGEGMWEGIEGEAPREQKPKPALILEESHTSLVLPVKQASILEEDNDESSDEDDAVNIPVIPALIDSNNNPNNKPSGINKIIVANEQNNTRSIEKKYRFDTKPMGFTIWADEEKEEILVDNVRDSSLASAYGVCKNWVLVEVNGRRDMLDMFEMLEDDDGPFEIVFKVYVDDVASQNVNVLSSADRAREINNKKLNTFNNSNLEPVNYQNKAASPRASTGSILDRITDEAVKAEMLRLQKSLEQLTQTNEKLKEEVMYSKIRDEMKHEDKDVELKNLRMENEQLKSIIRKQARVLESNGLDMNGQT